MRNIIPDFFVCGTIDMRVKIRNESDHYLAYFTDSRRIVGVSKIGAFILDCRLNKEVSIDDIARRIATNYGISESRARDDIILFFNEVREEVVPREFNAIEQEQLSAPLGVELEITSACNLRCKHCFQSDYSESFMSAEKACEIIGILAENGVFEVSLIGGEPFRHPELFSILEYCDSRDMAINIVTNATLLTDETIEKLAVMRRLVLLVSLDGIGNTHDAIRGKGSFAKTDVSLRKLVKRGISVETLCTINARNISAYKEVVSYCDQLGIPCNFNLFKPFKAGHEALVPEPSAFFDMICELLRMRQYEKKRIGLSNAAIVAELIESEPRNECRATRSGIVINKEGKIVPCPSLVVSGCYSEDELPIFDKHFLDTWREHPLFQAFRENGLRQCQARSYIFSGNVQGNDPYGIDAFRRHRESILK